MYTYDDNNENKPELPEVLNEVMQHLKPGAIVATYSSINPTCPQCQRPITARDAMLIMGQVAIWLQCECGYETVAIVEASRLNNPQVLQLDWLKCQIERGNLLFECIKPDCDDRPFAVTSGQLQDADGWIECDVCGEKCIEL